jgi:hypothetical protein
MISEFNKFAGNKILHWLLMNPNARIYINELARETGSSPSTVLRYSRIFMDAGIVTIQKVANAHLIILNTDHPVVKELKRCTILLLLDEYGIKDIAGNAMSIALYGSAASGTFSEASDIDILVAGTEEQVNRGKILEIQEKIRKNIQLTVIPWYRLEKMKKEKDPFIMSLICNHILLCGMEL